MKEQDILDHLLILIFFYNVQCAAHVRSCERRNCFQVFTRLLSSETCSAELRLKFRFVGYFFDLYYVTSRLAGHVVVIFSMVVYLLGSRHLLQMLVICCCGLNLYLSHVCTIQFFNLGSILFYMSSFAFESRLLDANLALQRQLTLRKPNEPRLFRKNADKQCQALVLEINRNLMDFRHANQVIRTLMTGLVVINSFVALFFFYFVCFRPDKLPSPLYYMVFVAFSLNNLINYVLAVNLMAARLQKQVCLNT